MNRLAPWSLALFLAIAAWMVFRGAPAIGATTTVTKDLGSSVTYLEREITGPVKTRLHLVFFDASRVAVKILDQPEKKTAGRIGDVLAASRAIAGCNGGYYDLKTFGPAGLQIASGRSTGKLDAASVHNGVLLVERGSPAIRPAQEIKILPDITELIQCSPMLIHAGKIVFGSPSDVGKNTRTFVATDGRGKWLIGTCKNATLTELGQMLHSPAVIPEFVVSEALNLDGGPSSGLWCVGRDGQARYVAEGSRVRNIVAVMPR